MHNIQEKSQQVFKEVQSLIENKIVNAALSVPIRNSTNFQTSMDEYLKRLSKEESYNLKQYWIPLMLATCAILHNVMQEKPNYRELAVTFLIGITVYRGFYQMFGHIPFENYGAAFLNEKEALQMDLQIKQRKVHLQRQRGGPLGYFSFFSDLNNFYDGKKVSFFEHECMLSALFAVKNGTFDCIAISGIVILKLIESKISEKIERFSRCGQVFDPHSYIVVNRTTGISTDINTWNDDCIILDPWYGVCQTVKEIREDKCFLLQYPLLNPQNKSCVTISEQLYSSQYIKDMVNKLNGLIAEFQKKSLPKKAWGEWLELDLLFPRISTPKQSSEIGIIAGTNHLKNV